MLARYYHTLRGLKPIQITNRLRRKIFKPKARPVPTLTKRAIVGHPQPWLTKPMVNMDGFHFHCHGMTINLAQANAWHSTTIPRLANYHLHYFDLLFTAGEHETQKKLIDDWLQHNPPGTSPGWEPYPLSQRVVNWIKWDLQTHALSEQALASLVQQGDYLMQSIEWHLLGNHLLTNAKALLFLGLFFTGPLADQWKQQALSIYQKQLPEQLLTDGGHVERSPIYHALLLEDLLDIINCYQAYQQAIPHFFIQPICPMFSWLEKMTHPNGEYAAFNDCALEQAPNLSKLIQYQTNLMASPPNSETPEKRHTSQTNKTSGYQRLSHDKATLIIDAAPIGPRYLPGHAHADTLSFELSLQGQRFLVNSGTSSYENNPLRHWQRSTKAHNTLIINQENSSQVWHAFRAARQATIVKSERHETNSSITFLAAHDGYSRMPGQYIHTRQWQLSHSRCEITDMISGKLPAKIQLFLYTHPDIDLTREDLRLTLCHHTTKTTLRCEFPQGCALEVNNSHWYPSFGQQFANKQVCVTLPPSVPQQCRWILSWD